MVPEVVSWSNIQRSFLKKLPPIWHHFQVHLISPCPLILQEETWRTGGVLAEFLICYLNENFKEASKWCFLLSDPISRFIWNLHVLQDSMKRLRGKVESWLASWCLIFMKISQKLPKNATSYLTPSPGSSGTSMSSKAPGRDLEEMWSLDWLPDVHSYRKFHISFQRMLPPI